MPAISSLNRFRGPNLALILGVACAGGRLAAQQQRLDDAAILSVMARVTGVEVECTGYTSEHATLPGTKRLAQQLHDDHTVFMAEGRRVAEQLGVTLDPRIKSIIADSHAAVLADLHAMSGINLDLAFVEHEIGLLQFAMDYVSRVMLPAAKDTSVRRLLLTATPLLRGHLELARTAWEAVKKAVKEGRTENGGTLGRHAG